MKKVRIEHATDNQLNWLVAKIKGLLGDDGKLSEAYCDSLRHDQDGGFVDDWDQGGPLLPEGKVTVMWDWGEWYAYSVGHTNVHWAETYLKAGIRVFVSIHLGDEAEVPDELS